MTDESLTSQHHPLARWILSTVAAVSFGLAACSSDSSDKEPNPRSDGAPKYLAALATPTADSFATYTVTTPGIDGTIMQYFLKFGLETAGYVSPSSYAGNVYVPRGDDPSITKYGVNADGTLEPTQTLGFAALGIKERERRSARGRDTDQRGEGLPVRQHELSSNRLELVLGGQRILA